MATVPPERSKVEAFDQGMFVIRCPCCRHPLSARQGPKGPGFFCGCNPMPLPTHRPGGWNRVVKMREDSDDLESIVTPSDYLAGRIAGEGAPRG